MNPGVKNRQNENIGFWGPRQYSVSNVYCNEFREKQRLFVFVELLVMTVFLLYFRTQRYGFSSVSIF